MFRRLAEEGAAATRESLAAAGPLDLVEASRRAFADFAPDIAGAAVFLDDGAAETAHYACGVSFLLGLGARNVFALPVASSATTAKRRADDDGTNDASVASCDASNLAHLASLVDVAGAPLPADAPLVVFTHRFTETVAPDVLALVRHRPEASRVLVATAAAAEAHAADKRAAARAAGASPAAANAVAADAEAKQARALRMGVLAILAAEDGSASAPRAAKDGSASAPRGDDAFAAAEWGDWGSGDDAADAFATDETPDAPFPETNAKADSNDSNDANDANDTRSSRFVAARFPAPFVPLSAGAFVFPADSAAATARLSLAPTPPADGRDERLKPLCPSYEDGTEEDGGDAPAPAGVGVLAATLAQFGSACGFSRFECFALGRTARAVARAVAASGPVAARRDRADGNGKPCALLLVDRVADVLTPAIDEAFRGDDDDAFLAAAFSTGARPRPLLSKRAEGAARTFARADFAFRLAADDDGDADAGSGSGHGAAAHPNDAEARRFADASTRRTLLQTAVAARRWVADAAREEGVVFGADASAGDVGTTSGRRVASRDVSASELRSMLAPFLADPRLRLRRGAMTQAVALVAACLEDREARLAARRPADAEGGFSFAAAAREMTRDAANAVATRAGEGAAAAAVAASLRRALARATRDLEEERGDASPRRRVSATSVSALAVAAYAAAGEAAARERRALGLRGADVFSDEEAEEEAEDADEAADEARVARGEEDPASASPFGLGDERGLRDALADFAVASASRDRSFARSTDRANDDDATRVFSPDWLGDDLAARLAAAGASEGDAAERAALVRETRDACERFLRRLGDVARARRRYASCGGLVDFSQAVGSGFSGHGAGLGGAHRSLVRELAERVSAGADGGGGEDAGEPDACDDVAHVASSVGGFLKSGVGGVLGRFGLRGPAVLTAPRPSESPTVLVFVLGGITAREIRDARAAAEGIAKTGFFGDDERNAEVRDILVGSTGVLCGSGEDVVAMVG